jgi:DNA-directed RNA polymerase subunit beta
LSRIKKRKLANPLIKRERFSFGQHEEVLSLPSLTSIQTDSFKWFINEGAGQALNDVSPIEDPMGRLRLELTEHFFAPPKYSEGECRERDMTFARPLFVTARFLNSETGEIKEQTLFLGDFPVMTERGTFIVNGTERVVVSQLVRSPGVYFGITADKTAPGKYIFDSKFIPSSGAWLEFEIDKRDILHVRIDRKRKMPATYLLKALGFGDTDQEIADLFKDADGNTYNVIDNTLAKDKAESIDDAFIEIYKRIRPNEPASAESARLTLENMYFNSKRYDLARVGRHRVAKKLSDEYQKLDLKKFNLEIPSPDVEGAEVDNVLFLSDIFAAVSYLIKLHGHEDGYYQDDIDHFGNRRVRSVGELIQNQFKIGLSRMERNVRERMNTQDVESITPGSLINIRPVAAALKEFFGSSQLSQFMDQTNPLSSLTHKRRLSALGPGGLTRERAGFEVRDVHSSHYGRMCPIETPDGPNIGLIGYLASYAKINKFGFIETPYRKVVKGKVTDKLDYLSADDEDRYTIAQANAQLDDKGNFTSQRVLSRAGRGEIAYVPGEEIDYMDVSPRQIVSIGTSLIPFLEHDDANRALMGANMQRQAVPLIQPTAPYVATGVEADVARDAGYMLNAQGAGVVKYADGRKIIVQYDDEKKETTHLLDKFRRSNQGTCINQRPIVEAGEKVQANQPIADSPASHEGELALGKNLLVAFMPWHGYNFEDAIVISNRLVKDDSLTSIHIEEYELDARDTKLGSEEITRDIPNLSEEILKDLDERGIIRIGAEVSQGDVLVGKVTPKGETELTPEERLLRAIFGEKAREVRDTSLKVPHGQSGKVIDVKVFARELGDELSPGVNTLVRVYVAKRRKIGEGDKLAGRHGNKGVISKVLPEEDMPYLADGTPVDIVLNPLGVPSRMNVGQVLESHLGYLAKHGWTEVKGEHTTAEAIPQRPYPITKTQTISEPSVWTSTPVFDAVQWDENSNTPDEINLEKLFEHMNPDGRDGSRLVGNDGKAWLYDGRTGERFDNPVSIGYMYILKLNHLVDDKIHARSTGPYSMITQQPLGGKAQFGGQRFGEMEVWALEAYGAAYALQEILTIKSDDVLGRVKVYESIVKGENIPEPGTPESFKVLIKEMQALSLDVQVLDENGNEAAIGDVDDEAYKRVQKLGIDLSRPEKEENIS